MRILFAGGGTGGHIYPALAVAGELRRIKPDIEMLFIAGLRGIEQRIYRNAGYPMETINVTGMPRSISPALAPFAWRLGVSSFISAGIIRRFKPAAVVATGGYVSGPPIIAAWIMGTPVAIQEQNSYPGVTTRKLARFADIIFLGFPEAEPYFPAGVETVVTGNPVRAGITAGERVRGARSFGLDPERRTLLVFGGSQGASAINRAMDTAVADFADSGFQVIWQTGEREHEDYKRHNGAGDGCILVLPYLDNMPGAYAAADLAVTRAGAMTLAELAACGLPSVLVPLSTAAANHQEHNARAVETAGAARMILERDLTPQILGETVTGIIGDDDTREAMAAASRRVGRPRAAMHIAEQIIKRYGTD